MSIPWPEISTTLVSSLLKIFVIIFLALIARWGVKIIASRIEKRVNQTMANSPRLARLLTLVLLARSTSYVLIVLLAVLMILNSLGINIAPILASAGVVGLALSLGTQTLVKDLFSGLLILLENQYGVGDSIRIEDVTGVVESLSLRTTALRDVQGTLHIFANGDIRKTANLSAEWSRAVVDLNLAFDADIRRAVEILRDAMEQVKIAPEIRSELIEDPTVEGWVGLTDWAVQVRLMAKTNAGKQVQVAGVLRQAALDALQAGGIPLAKPPSVI
ncbi:MAG: mechanosensitive ion channel family protein [Anaerolineales bacterium]|nr:mechanosensitive ion channel family protein [Anaerolineales bacterium]